MIRSLLRDLTIFAAIAAPFYAPWAFALMG
jgi:hypothetical protein